MDRIGTRSVLVTLLVVFITQVYGKLCPNTDNVYCSEDEYCCGTECCQNYSDFYYSGFWNIWYFWFIIFFILMTCCGGCGFYRRRQAYLSQRNNAVIRTQPTVVPPPRTQSPGIVGAYSIQPMPQGTFQGPPSYNEAVSKPYLYPKSETVYPPPTAPVNGVVPPPQPGPAYPPDGAYPNPAYPPPQGTSYYQSGMPMPQQEDSVGPMPAPPPYAAATAGGGTQTSAPQPTAPPTAS